MLVPNLVGLVFSFSSEPLSLRFTVDYVLDFSFFVSGFSDILFNTRPSRLWYSLLRAVLTPAQTISESRHSTLGYGIASAVPHLDSAPRLPWASPPGATERARDSPVAAVAGIEEAGPLCPAPVGWERSSRRSSSGSLTRARTCTYTNHIRARTHAHTSTQALVNGFWTIGSSEPVNQTMPVEETHPPRQPSRLVPGFPDGPGAVDTNNPIWDGCNLLPQPRSRSQPHVHLG
ncbi:hypothetical protein FJTKL_06376 [Diaporthe vaccinii]|uniref:Uncharacterized protein n=1 Tax=Diaporthe vaccinii TaxID=105482 RepID=A0ABR4EWL2_9PEZI